MLKKCKLCNRTFQSTQKTQIWCNKKCRYKGQYYNNKDNILRNKKKRYYKHHEDSKLKARQLRNNNIEYYRRKNKERYWKDVKKSRQRNKDRYRNNIEHYRNYFKDYGNTNRNAKVRRKDRHKEKDKQCGICNMREDLEKHHWRYDKQGVYSTLCIECHSIQHGRESKL